MKKLLKNLITVFLFVGILVSCESTDPLIEEAQTNMVLQNYDEAIALLDQSIEENPESGIPHYYKAMTFSENAAVIEDPNERRPYYEDFRESALTAREKFAAMEETPEEAEQVDNLILNAWGREHNAAIQYATNDSVMQSVEEPLKIAVAHLENAIIVNPDSALSYDVLAQVHFINENPEKAIVAQRNAMERKSPPSSEDFARLSDYYNNVGKTDSAIVTLNEGISMYADSINLSRKLADAYMASGERDSSIAVIEQLIEREPENAQYHLALGTQLLQATTGISDSISNNYDELYDLNSQTRNASIAESNELSNRVTEIEEQNQELQQEIDEMSEYAESALRQVIEINEDSESAYNALAVIYQNKAAALFDLRNYTTSDAEAQEYDNQAKEALREAMNHYEKVVELNPDNTTAWQNLANIYITLDMTDKVEEALERAGN